MASSARNFRMCSGWAEPNQQMVVPKYPCCVRDPTEHLQEMVHGHQVNGVTNARKRHCGYVPGSWLFATQGSRTSHNGNPVLSDGAQLEVILIILFIFAFLTTGSVKPLCHFICLRYQRLSIERDR